MAIIAPAIQLRTTFSPSAPALSAHLGAGALSTAPTANWAGLYLGGNIGALFIQNNKIDNVVQLGQWQRRWQWR